MTETQKRQLAEPFKAEDIEWRIASTNKEKTLGIAVAYVDSRAIQERLDSIFGCENWQNSFEITQGAEKDLTSYVCRIGIYSPERNEWIFKSDGAGPTDIEPVKGGLSGALKRAASIWNIGRYLYELEGVWVDIEQRGKSYVIKKEELERLKAYYRRAMHEKSQGRAVPPPPAKSGKPNSSDAPVKADTKPEPQTGGTADIRFRVLKFAVSNGSKGAQTLLTLQTPQNEIISGYMLGTPELHEGQIIHKLRLEEKSSPQHGKYNIIHGFEKVA